MKRVLAIVPALLLTMILGANPGRSAPTGQDHGLRVAVVDLNRALNDSQAGKRSKRLLLADKSQMESELKSEEAELKRLSDELESNIMLSEAARAEREKDVHERERKLRDAVKNAQRELQDKERRYTESIFNELKTVINLISKSENLDIVLEKAAAQVILFSSFEMQDITDKVIARYDTIQNGQ